MRPVTTMKWIPRARTRAIASRVRGRRIASRQISVRSKSHATAATSRGNRSGSGGGRSGQPEVDVTTYAATSLICFSESCPLNEGIAPIPFVTRSTTRT